MTAKFTREEAKQRFVGLCGGRDQAEKLLEAMAKGYAAQRLELDATGIMIAAFRPLDDGLAAPVKPMRDVRAERRHVCREIIANYGAKSGVSLGAWPEYYADKEPPSKSEINDKKWWYELCAAHSDNAETWARAREIYPSLFDGVGNLFSVHEVDFNANDRIDVPLAESRAYGSADALSPIIRRLARQAGQELPGEPARSEGPEASDDGSAVPDEIYERIAQLERDVMRLGGKAPTAILRQRAKQRSPERQIAMLEEWLARHETERLSQEQAEYPEAAEA